MTLKLSRDEHAKALHIQLMTYYRERILDGRLPVGTRLPTEMELAQEHQISRDTVRQALSLLVSEGLLERVQGRGTFVRLPSLPQTNVVQPEYKRIGVILNRPPTAQLNMEILIGVEQAAKSHGYLVSFTYAEEDQQQLARDISRLRADNVQGLVIFPASDTTYDESIWTLHAAQYPFVLIDRYFPDLACDYVGPDNFGGALRATEHLLILGYTRIGFAQTHVETRRTTSVHDRWRGYCEALEKYHIPYNESLIPPNTPLSHAEAIAYYTHLLSRPDRPDAIFAVNDMTALDIYDIAQQVGLRIPDDLAVVGFDNLSFAAHLHPALTTIAYPLTDAGLRAGNLLISRIEGLSGPVKHLELPANLIVRESCSARLRIRKNVSAM